MVQPGSELEGRFRLLEMVGVGGMAEVWRATDATLGAEVAIKIIRAELAAHETIRARFRSEAMNTRRARSEHVVDIHELFADAARPFFVMPLLCGQTLDEHLRQRGGLAYAEARELVIQLLRGLEVAHRCGVVHRDVKPRNIFLEEPRGGAGAVKLKLLDFGVAWDDQRSAALTSAGVAIGTPAYMAPEVRVGEGGAAPTADVFAAAIIAFEMITGSRPNITLGSKPRLLHETERGREAGVPPAFSRALDRAFEPDVSQRYQDAGEFLSALLALDAAIDIQPGALIDARYRVIDKLGEGGMAVVMRVFDERVGEEAALKLLTIGADAEPESEELKGRFIDECEIMMRLDHPRVVGIRGAGRWGSLSYCALDLVPGRTLSDSAPTLAWAQIVDVIRQVAGALDAVHAAGVVHRDVKADNIIIGEDGAATLIDFGVARLGEGWRTRTGFAIGTPGAEAPEQLVSGDITGATDQWALAALVYELLSGRAPGENAGGGRGEETTLQMMENVCAGEIEPIAALCPELPDPAARAIMRALAIDPADRYQSVTRFANELDQASRGWRRSRDQSRPARSWLWPSLAIAASATVIVGGALVVMSLGGEAPASLDSAPAPTPTATAAPAVEDDERKAATRRPSRRSKSKRPASSAKHAPVSKPAADPATPEVPKARPALPTIDDQMKAAEKMADEFERMAGELARTHDEIEASMPGFADEDGFDDDPFFADAGP